MWDTKLTLQRASPLSEGAGIGEARLRGEKLLKARVGIDWEALRLARTDLNPSVLIACSACEGRSAKGGGLIVWEALLASG